MPDRLRVFVLNVGDGDSIVIQFPDVNGRRHAVVDCRDFPKVQHVLQALNATELEFVCATHPHSDHISGMDDLLRAYAGDVREFWDSGFRHTSTTYHDMIGAIEDDGAIRFTRVTSGFERDVNGVKVKVLAPSIYLRNRFDTLGVNMNNASVVLMLEYQAEGAANASSIVLGGDAQFDSWGKVLEEFPYLERTPENDPRRVRIDRSFNPLNCQVLKVSHHGSKHGTALEYVERLSPGDAIVSCDEDSQYGFPHEIARLSLEDEVAPQRIYYTDGPAGHARSGTTVAWTRGRGRWTITALGEAQGAMPVVPP